MSRLLAVASEDTILERRSGRDSPREAGTFRRCMPGIAQMNITGRSGDGVEISGLPLKTAGEGRCRGPRSIDNKFGYCLVMFLFRIVESNRRWMIARLWAL